MRGTSASQSPEETEAAEEGEPGAGVTQEEVHEPVYVVTEKTHGHEVSKWSGKLSFSKLRT